MNPTGLVAHLSGAGNGTTDPSILRLLRAIREEQLLPSQLAEQYDIPRRTVYNRLEPLAEWGMVNPTDDAYLFTGAGRLVLDAYSDARDLLGEDELAFLAASDHRHLVLCTLSTQPATKAELSRVDDLSSRSTIHRIITTGETYGWIERMNGCFKLTPDGEEALDAYDDLIDTVANVDRATPCLRWVGEVVANLPTDPLADARIPIDTFAHPHRSLRAFCEFAEPEKRDNFRGFATVTSEEWMDAWMPCVKAEMDTEIIVTRDVAFDMPDERYTEQVKTAFDARNVEMRVVDDLQIGLAIIDNEIVILGAPNPDLFYEVTVEDVSGTIISDDEALLAWATDLYEVHRRESKSLVRHVLTLVNDQFRQILSRPVLTGE